MKHLDEFIRTEQFEKAIPLIEAIAPDDADPQRVGDGMSGLKRRAGKGSDKKKPTFGY